MTQYILRRLLTAIPTLLLISFVIFGVLELAPGDPTGALPETIRPEVRQLIREAMGLDKPMHVKYTLWLRQFFICEPLALLEKSWETTITVDDPYCQNGREFCRRDQTVSVTVRQPLATERECANMSLYTTDATRYEWPRSSFPLAVQAGPVCRLGPREVAGGTHVGNRGLKGPIGSSFWPDRQGWITT